MKPCRTAMRTALAAACAATAAAAGPSEVSGSEWSSLREAYQAGQHAAFGVGGGYRARNPGQQWTIDFDGQGFTAAPDGRGWAWGMQLVSYGRARDEHCVSKPLTVTAEGPRVAYQWDDRLTEWYVNDSRGLEHGYTVRAPLDAGVGPLTFALAVRGGLDPVISGAGRDVCFVDGEGNRVVTYSGLSAVDADGQVLRAGFEPTGTGLCLTVDDAGARYPLTIDPIAQQAYLKSSNTEANDRFGEAVAVSGDTVVVGAFLEDSSATGVGGNPLDNGALGSGAAYVFVRSGATWSQQAYFKASNTGAGDWFGVSVAISGDTVVVGAQEEDSGATGVNGDQNSNSAAGSGAAYVFVRSGTTWSQQAYLKAANTGAGDRFGRSVSVSGDTVVVGAYLEDSSATGVNGNPNDNGASDSGAAYVFVRSGTTWSQQAYLKASNTGALDNFAAALSLSDDTLVVGARAEDSSATGVNGDENDNGAAASGAAYVFLRSGAAWSQQAYLKASNSAAQSEFGFAVAASGDTLVAGARFEDGLGSNAGAAYVFLRSGTAWSQQAYLKSSNAGAADEFGYAVGVSGDTVVVGAHLEDSGATGVNGNQTDNSALGSGAAYVFVRSGATWSQQSYLKASNTGAADEFGYAVAVSGDAVVVAAPLEDSSATGVNGNGGDNGAADAGAAYVFAACSVAAAATAYGTGKAGSAGVPALGSVNPPVLNTIADLTITGGLPGAAPVFLFAGFAPAAILFDAGTLRVSPAVVAALPALDGSGSLALPIPVTAWACGVHFYFQAMFADPAAAGFYHTAQTNGLDWTIGG